MAIGELLKSYRKVSGFSVKETVQKLSERGIDVSEKTLYSWESGHRQPDADTFITLNLSAAAPQTGQTAGGSSPSWT